MLNIIITVQTVRGVWCEVTILLSEMYEGSEVSLILIRYFFLSLSFRSYFPSSVKLKLSEFP